MPSEPSHSAAGPEPATSPGFITVRNLVAGYGGKVAVDNISFSVAAGEHLSLLGPSGCGKSTTLRCIAGLETPFEGEIAIGGNVVYSSKDRINLPPEKRNLAMVFQSYAIWPHMSVFENVAYGLRIKGPRGEQLNEQVHRALEMVGMREYADRQATDLSDGQQQRVALARSYAFLPQALLRPRWPTLACRPLIACARGVYSAATCCATSSRPARAPCRCCSWRGSRAVSPTLAERPHRMPRPRGPQAPPRRSRRPRGGRAPMTTSAPATRLIARRMTPATPATSATRARGTISVAQIHRAVVQRTGVRRAPRAIRARPRTTAGPPRRNVAATFATTAARTSHARRSGTAR